MCSSDLKAQAELAQKEFVVSKGGAVTVTVLGSKEIKSFRGLSQSTIGDTRFPCLVRNGTEGDSRSIITRINPANIIISNFKNLSTLLFKHFV